MGLSLEELKESIPYKRIPILTLDERYVNLFSTIEKTDKIKTLENMLTEAMKRQGKITNDLKAMHKVKSQLMQDIMQNVDNTELSDNKRQKIMNTSQKLILESKVKIEKLEEEELLIPDKIKEINLALMAAVTELCYDKINSNTEDIENLDEWINKMRIELKKRILIKQDKEVKNTLMYSCMHDILGPDIMEVFDSKNRAGKK